MTETTGPNSSSTPRFPSYVIAITGPAGAGKTTLVRRIAQLLGDATTLFFDDYEREPTSREPEDIRSWLAAGADPDAWARPTLASHLHTLRSGQSVVNPRYQRSTEPARYLVLEDPFGRARTETAPLVNFVAALDLPLEIALARRLRAWADAPFAQSDPARYRDMVARYLDAYLSHTRELYATVNRRAIATADLTLDGTQPPDDLAAQVVSRVTAQRGC